MNDWVQCDSCKKWRKLPEGMNPASLSNQWTCNQVNWETDFNCCSKPEEKNSEEKETTFLQAPEIVLPTILEYCLFSGKETSPGFTENVMDSASEATYCQYKCQHKDCAIMRDMNSQHVMKIFHRGIFRNSVNKNRILQFLVPALQKALIEDQLSVGSLTGKVIFSKMQIPVWSDEMELLSQKDRQYYIDNDHFENSFFQSFFHLLQKEDEEGDRKFLAETGRITDQEYWAYAMAIASSCYRPNSGNDVLLSYSMWGILFKSTTFYIPDNAAMQDCFPSAITKFLDYLVNHAFPKAFKDVTEKCDDHARRPERLKNVLFREDDDASVVNNTLMEIPLAFKLPLFEEQLSYLNNRASSPEGKLLHLILEKFTESTVSMTGGDSSLCEEERLIAARKRKVVKMISLLRFLMVSANAKNLQYFSNTTFGIFRNLPDHVLRCLNAMGITYDESKNRKTLKVLASVMPLVVNMMMKNTKWIHHVMYDNFVVICNNKGIPEKDVVSTSKTARTITMAFSGIPVECKKAVTWNDLSVPLFPIDEDGLMDFLTCPTLFAWIFDVIHNKLSTIEFRTKKVHDVGCYHRESGTRAMKDNVIGLEVAPNYPSKPHETSLAMRAKALSDGAQYAIADNTFVGIVCDSEIHHSELLLTLRLHQLLGPSNNPVGGGQRFVRLKNLINNKIEQLDDEMKEQTEKKDPEWSRRLSVLKIHDSHVANMMSFFPLPATRFHEEKYFAQQNNKLNPLISSWVFCIGLSFRLLYVDGYACVSLSDYLEKKKIKTKSIDIASDPDVTLQDNPENDLNEGENEGENEEDKAPASNIDSVDALLLFHSKNFTVEERELLHHWDKTAKKSKNLTSSTSSSSSSSSASSASSFNLCMDYGLRFTKGEEEVAKIKKFIDSHKVDKESEAGQKQFQSTLVNRALAVNKVLANCCKSERLINILEQSLAQDENEPLQNVARHIQGYIRPAGFVVDTIDEYITTGDLSLWIKFLSQVAVIAAASQSENITFFTTTSITIIAWIDEHCPKYILELAVAMQVLDDFYSECVNAVLKGNVSSDTPHNTLMSVLRTKSALGPLCSSLEEEMTTQFGLAKMRTATLERSSPTQSHSQMTKTEQVKMDKNLNATVNLFVEMLDLAEKGKLELPPYVDINDVGLTLLPMLHLKAAGKMLRKVCE